jgi:hypothetical protein
MVAASAFDLKNTTYWLLIEMDNRSNFKEYLAAKGHFIIQQQC